MNRSGETIVKKILVAALAALIAAGSSAAALADGAAADLEELPAPPAAVEPLDGAEADTAEEADAAAPDEEEAVSEEEPAPAEEASAAEEAPAGFGGLSPALLAAAAPELTALDGEQRAELARRWTENSFHFADAGELMGYYDGLGLSGEAAFVVLLANADACVRYVAAGYAGNAASLSVFCDSFAALTDELAAQGLDFSRPDGLESALRLIGAAYEAMIDAGDEGAERDGQNFTNDLVLAYGGDEGAEDAGRFLALFPYGV